MGGRARDLAVPLAVGAGGRRRAATVRAHAADDAVATAARAQRGVPGDAWPGRRLCPGGSARPGRSRLCRRRVDRSNAGAGHPGWLARPRPSGRVGLVPGHLRPTLVRGGEGPRRRLGAYDRRPSRLRTVVGQAAAARNGQGEPARVLRPAGRRMRGDRRADRIHLRRRHGRLSAERHALLRRCPAAAFNPAVHPARRRHASDRDRLRAGGVPGLAARAGAGRPAFRADWRYVPRFRHIGLEGGRHGSRRPNAECCCRRCKGGAYRAARPSLC